jgi:hypothetical protein
MQELYLNLDPDNFYCPVTGHPIMSLEETFSPSLALMFLYLHEVQEFEYVHDSIQEKFAPHFKLSGEVKNAEKLYKRILRDGYMGENERILIHFGQLSPASMCFDFSIQDKPLEAGLKSV